MSMKRATLICAGLALIVMTLALTGVLQPLHVFVNGKKTTMRDFVSILPERPFTLPVVLIVGTSMSAGKTSSARIIVRLLKEAGLKVIGAKLTGAGRYRDILSVRDAGADWIFDFVDVGLPSTVCPEEEYRRALRPSLPAKLRTAPQSGR